MPSAPPFLKSDTVSDLARSHIPQEVAAVLYTATIRDATILSEFDLARVLELLADIQAAEEDAVIWQGQRVVAVRLGSGRVLAVEAAPVAA